MNKLFQYSLFIALATTLCACPYDSPFAIDDTPLQPIDESLLGTWVALVVKPTDDQHYKKDTVKLIFDKRSDMEYDIAITGNIEELKPYKVITRDTIKGTAFISIIDKATFVNASIYGKVYIAEIKQQDKNISILTLSEHFTSKYIKNSKALRGAIEFHYKTRPLPNYDEWFLMKNIQRVN